MKIDFEKITEMLENIKDLDDEIKNGDMTFGSAEIKIKEILKNIGQNITDELAESISEKIYLPTTLDENGTEYKYKKNSIKN